MQSQIAVVAPPAGSHLPRGGPGATVGTLWQGYLLLLQQGKARVVIRNHAVKGGAAGPHGSGPYLAGATAPDPLPAWGRVRRRHVSLRKGSSELTAEASDPP
jgi:hypothetical protein